MNNKEFGKSLEKRTKLLAVRIIKLSASLPESIESRVIRNQLTKSGSSIGANYFEANKSRSKKDFLNKLKISESEANETLFWLAVLEELAWVKETQELEEISKEVKELLAIFISVGNKLRSND
ncbi:MAG: four helix bundle protein [Vicingaceae bacterium]